MFILKVNIPLYGALLFWKLVYVYWFLKQLDEVDVVNLFLLVY